MNQDKGISLMNWNKEEFLDCDRACVNCNSEKTRLKYIYKYNDTIIICSDCGHQELYCTGKAQEFKDYNANSK